MKKLLFLALVAILFFPNLTQGQCAPFHSGYINVGQLNGHNYYLSIDNAKPTDAQAAAEALGGYLAVIDDEEEDDFLLNYIDELTYIGLNDATTEGTFEWFNGPPVGYTNIDPCGFCTSNSEDQDYVVKEPWGAGGWSFSNFWNARKYMVEIPCGMSNTDCAFSNERVNNNIFDNDIADRVNETADGFELNFESFGVGTRWLARWEIDQQGQTISDTDFEIPYPSGMDFGRFSNLGDYFFMHDVDGLNPQLVKVDFSGSIVWTKNYVVNTTIPNVNFTSFRDAWEDADGILITGHSGVNATNGVRQPFLIKTDLDGNEIWQQLLSDENSFVNLEVLSRSSDGGYYLKMTGGSTTTIIKIDANGNEVWRYGSPTVNSEERNFVGESSDGNSFYFTYADGYFTDELLLIKLNANDGSFGWERNLGDYFSLANTSNFGFRLKGAVAADNGGVMFNFTLSGNTSSNTFNKYGLIDPSGNLVWGYDEPKSSANFQMVQLATSDGGYLFTGTNSNDFKYVWKYTSDGWNAPVCGTAPTGLQVNCDLNIDPSELQVFSSDPSGNNVNWLAPTAMTDCPGGIVSIEQVSGPPSGSFIPAWVTQFIVYIITDACGNEKECYYELEVNGLYGGINCPNDITVDATSADGAVVNFDLPTISPTTCIPGAPNQTSGLPSGSVFPIGTTEIQYVSFFGGSTTYCQNGISCSFTITVNPMNNGGGCPGNFAGFTTIGEFGDSKYYISNDVSRPVDAQAVAEMNGGYLAAISSQEENDFIQQNISDMVYIGLNDYDAEGSLEWFNGEAFTFDNINPCGFCNENSEEQDFVIMAPWDGAWSFSNFWNSRKYIMEVPCGGNTGGGGDCAFITKVGVSPSQTEIIKTNDGYQAKVLTSSFDIDYQEVNLNANGVVTSINDVAPDMPNSSTYFKAENFYVTYPMIDVVSFDLTAYEVDGTPKWNSTFDINTIDPFADQLVNLRVIDVGNGIMIYGAYHFGNAGTWRKFVLKMDYDGNEIFQNNHDITNEYPTISEVQSSADGGIYYTRRSDSAAGYFGRITGTGEFAWENYVIGDLVTNKMYLVGETLDEQSVYLSVANNNSYKAFVRKYNVTSGNELWEVDLNDVFSPGRTGSTFGYRGAAVTPDGGIIAAITYTEVGNNYNGTEYGRLDANGNLMWWHDAPIGFYGMQANAALSDGSLFFTQSNSGNFTTIIRTNEDGTFDPACTNGNSPDLDLANLNFYSSPLQVGQTYNAEFEIHNNDLATASQYEVAIFLKEYDFSNPNPAEYFVDSYAYSNTEFGFFETSVDFEIPNIPEGQYKLKLMIDYGNEVAESDENNNTIESSGVFNLENNGGGDLPDLTVSNLTNFPSSTETGVVVSFNFDLNNIGTVTAAGDYYINMYISSDDVLSADDMLVGEVPTGDTPVGTIPNVPGAIAIPNLPDGNYILIISADDLDDIEESNENNNTLTADFEVTSGGGGCPASLPGYTSLGEFDGSAYFLSDDVARAIDAQTAAEALGGNLATIDSQAENDFLFPQIGELAYIGLNDYEIEGALEWFSGDPVNFTNFNICGFCNENTDDMDFVVMHSWNGGWSWSNFYNSRKYIVEIPCNSSSNEFEITYDCPSEFPQEGIWEVPVTLTNNTSNPSYPFFLSLYVKGNGTGPNPQSTFATVTVPILGAGESTTIILEAELPEIRYYLPNRRTFPTNYISEFTYGDFYISRSATVPQPTIPFDFYCKKYTTDLEVAIQNPIPNFTSDNEVIYTVAVTNNGDEDAYNIQTEIFKSIASSYADGSPPNMTVDYSADIINMSGGNWERLFGGNYVWYLSELGVGETATVDVIYHLDDPLEYGANLPDDFTVNVSTTSGHLLETNESNNTSTFIFENENGGDCPDVISGFTLLGEFEGNKYFISDDVSQPIAAQIVAQQNNGYLAVINSQEENDFLQQGISEMTYIGLNDVDTEGDLVWENGDPLNYNNINSCSFCNENSEELDYVIMAPWDGAWSFSSVWNARKYIVEIPCGSTLVDPTNNNFSIVAADFEIEEDQLSLEKIYPNPTMDNVFVNIISQKDQSLPIEIFDARGILVRTEVVSLVGGENTIELQASNLPDGVYSIFISQIKGKPEVKRFVKVRN